MDQEIQKQSIPWAQRKEIGLFKALWRTIKQVLFKPGEFFGNLEIKDSYLEPFLFYFIILLTVTAISFLLSPILNKKLTPLPVSGLMLTFLMPLSIIITLYIGSAFLHLCVLLFGGKGGFKGTFNVIAYNAATSIFSIIPFVGGLISFVWAVVVGTIGFKRIHKISTLRAAFAYCGFPFAIVMIIALMAAIAIPNLLKARLTANETAAEATAGTISTAIETYRASNGRFPSDEYDLRYAQPPYLTEPYNNKTIMGYDYSLTFSGNGYEIVARPSVCGSTGFKIFRVTTDGLVSQERCKQ